MRRIWHFENTNVKSDISEIPMYVYYEKNLSYKIWGIENADVAKLWNIRLEKPEVENPE